MQYRFIGFKWVHMNSSRGKYKKNMTSKVCKGILLEYSVCITALVFVFVRFSLNTFDARTMKYASGHVSTVCRRQIKIHDIEHRSHEECSTVVKFDVFVNARIHVCHTGIYDRLINSRNLLLSVCFI